MIILLHTSKTMRPASKNSDEVQTPELINKANELASYLKTLKTNQLAKSMHISIKLADKTKDLLDSWTDNNQYLKPAIDSFLGDIYSGLQVNNWNESDRKYANKHLKILSGLYGILKPLDGIYPYRLEMGYRLPSPKYSNLYKFWGEDIANTLDNKDIIINLSAKEYSKVITDYIDKDRIITPIFLTMNESEPTFVVVHAKIARGAFASWLITNRVDSLGDLQKFKEIGYEYRENLSNPNEPVFVCREFGGKGLSVRLS